MNPNNDIQTIQSSFSVGETVKRLEKLFLQRNITIYASIDQQAEATKSGLTLRPLQLLIFGNPKGGVPLMQANPLSGLDLPLKLLVWEDDTQKVWLSYNHFTYLQNRFGLPATLIESLSVIESVFTKAASLP
jgi:uncharacterized protein (DUF302 family)